MNDTSMLPIPRYRYFEEQSDTDTGNDYTPDE